MIVNLVPRLRANGDSAATATTGVDESAKGGTNPPREVTLPQHPERSRHEPGARRGDVLRRLEPHGPARADHHPRCRLPFVERGTGGIRSPLGTILRPACSRDCQPEGCDGGGGHAVAITAADFGPSPIALTADIRKTEKLSTLPVAHSLDSYSAPSAYNR